MINIDVVVKVVEDEKQFTKLISEHLSAETISELPIIICDSDYSAFRKIFSYYSLELPPIKPSLINIQLSVSNIHKMHPVLGFKDDITGKIGKRYARLLKRDYYEISSKFQHLHLDRPLNPTLETNYTIFTPANLENGYSLLLNIQNYFISEFEKAPPIAFIASNSLKSLSWFLLKQLIVIGSSENKTMSNRTFFLMNSSSAQEMTSPHQISSLEDIRDVENREYEQCFIFGHSRPHCGIIQIGKHILGICGSSTKAENDKCFNNTECFFTEKPKLRIELIKAKKIFYNGCATGQISKTQTGIPTDSLLAFNAMRGYASEVIGNYRVGRYNEWDIWWFWAFSAMNYSPAESILKIKEIRAQEGREEGFSLVYLGDSMNKPWVIEGVEFGKVEVGNKKLKISWKNSSNILFALVESGPWVELAAKNKLKIKNEAIEGDFIIKYAFDKNSNKLFILSKVAEKSINNGHLKVTISEKRSHSKQRLGKNLGNVIEQLDFISQAGFEAELFDIKQKAVKITMRFSTQSNYDNDVLYDDKYKLYLKQEDEIIKLIDLYLMGQVIIRAAKGGWYWEESYMKYVKTSINKEPINCPICKGIAHSSTSTHGFLKKIQRIQTICAECGIISDIPNWSFDIKFKMSVAESPGKTLKEAIVIINKGKKKKSIVAQLQVQGTPQLTDISNPFIGSINPYEEVDHLFHATFQKVVSGFRWIRVHIVSEGCYGFISKPFIFYES